MNTETLETNFRELKEKHNIFDINCYIPAPDESFLETVPAEPEALLDEGINRLVLADKDCLKGDVISANESLIKRVSSNSAFFAAPVIAPEMNLGGKNFGSYLSYLIDNKSVILRVFPQALRHSLKKWQMGDIFRSIERRRIPLMIWHTHTDFDTVAEILESYPGLPVILEGSDQKIIYYTRYVIGLCEKYKNLYLEMHNFTQYGFLQYALKNIGCERLLFGSFSPYNNMNGVLNMIFANTDDSGAEQILSKNFERLMSEII